MSTIDTEKYRMTEGRILVKKQDVDKFTSDAMFAHHKQQDMLIATVIKHNSSLNIVTGAKVWFRSATEIGGGLMIVFVRDVEMYENPSE